MSVHLGWWAVPALITLLAIGQAFAPEPAPRGYGDIGTGIVGMFKLMLGVIVSLVAWLVWAVL